MGTITFTIRADHPAFAGHFPGAPILPGVVLLDEALHALEPASAPYWKVSSVKFLRPVLPGDTLTLQHERQANGSIRFTIQTAGQLVANGLFTPHDP
jgi:3-hydroxymyristoyl/3-hydroxydecanoyl-(acyl carrier protein) dehydratase